VLVAEGLVAVDGRWLAGSKALEALIVSRAAVRRSREQAAP
jgi:hypothetical protein